MLEISNGPMSCYAGNLVGCFAPQPTRGYTCARDLLNTNAELWIERRISVDRLIKCQRSGEGLVSESVKEMSTGWFVHGRYHENTSEDEGCHMLVGWIGRKAKAMRLEVSCEKLEQMPGLIHRCQAHRDDSQSRIAASDVVRGIGIW